MTNLGYNYRKRVRSHGAGQSLLEWLATRYGHSGETDWRDRIECGRVRVDGERGAPDSVLREGQVVEWRRPPWREPDAPRSFRVLHDAGGVIAVSKPAGLPTLPGGGFLENTLLHVVRERYPDASPVHRLGRWTSGLVLFARTDRARTALAEAWRTGRVYKRYRALAAGSPVCDRFKVTVPIGRVPHPLLGTVHASHPRGRPSRTEVEVLERRPGSFLADVVIATGRPHQIRIHLAAAGHPLVGDPLYRRGGVLPAHCTALPGDPGYHLHAAKLTVSGGLSVSPLSVECRPPERLRTDVER